MAMAKLAYCQRSASWRIGGTKMSINEAQWPALKEKNACNKTVSACGKSSNTQYQ